MSVHLKWAAVGFVAAMTLTACATDAAGDKASDGTSAPSDSVAATATSAADFGGLEGLVTAAKAEGQINVIALPDDWANYGALKALFEETYGITVNSILPDASSKEEIAAAEANKGTAQAPDVFDLGTAVTLESTDYFAPYQVENWEHIPDINKEPTGLWVNDYTGIMSVGYNASKYDEITSLADLTREDLRGTVALNGKPSEAGAAFNGFLMANAVAGGTFDDIEPGLKFFGDLAAAGTLNVKDVTNGTIDAGEHGVVMDWSYNQLSTVERLADKGVEWKVFVPEGGEIAAFYNQAINKDAPHPAAARLWQEFLFSAEAQNLWLAGGARPVLFDWLEETGALDAAAAENLPEVAGEPTTPTIAQAEAANAVLAEKWESAVS